ncbi:hypothetical protein [Halanaerobium sp.]|jgi:hypothetical protein|uniref:hypothetical protein n=1 Tax=Halanaerobium sp. TaxID=1895664 RepID=UPI000DE6AFE8|nr:hypothetical protein [Halanaerobium sp.]PUU87248.1 MAG: hypothetical protein CI949_3666 [Halanaerobium sp.]
MEVDYIILLYYFIGLFIITYLFSKVEFFQNLSKKYLKKFHLIEGKIKNLFDKKFKGKIPSNLLSFMKTTAVTPLYAFPLTLVMTIVMLILGDISFVETMLIILFFSFINISFSIILIYSLGSLLSFLLSGLFFLFDPIIYWIDISRYEAEKFGNYLTIILIVPSCVIFCWFYFRE